MSGKVIGDALAQKTVPIPRLEKAKDVVEVKARGCSWVAGEGALVREAGPQRVLFPFLCGWCVVSVLRACMKGPVEWAIFREKRPQLCGRALGMWRGKMWIGGMLRSQEHRDWQTVWVVRFNIKTLNIDQVGLATAQQLDSHSPVFSSNIFHICVPIHTIPATFLGNRLHLFNQPFSVDFHLTQMPSWAGFKSCLAVLAGARRVNQGRRKGLGSSKSNCQTTWLFRMISSTFLLLWFVQFSGFEHFFFQ